MWSQGPSLSRAYPPSTDHCHVTTHGWLRNWKTFCDDQLIKKNYKSVCRRKKGETIPVTQFNRFGAKQTHLGRDFVLRPLTHPQKLAAELQKERFERNLVPKKRTQQSDPIKLSRLCWIPPPGWRESAGSWGGHGRGIDTSTGRNNLTQNII